MDNEKKPPTEAEQIQRELDEAKTLTDLQKITRERGLKLVKIDIPKSPDKQSLQTDDKKTGAISSGFFLSHMGEPLWPARQD